MLEFGHKHNNSEYRRSIGAIIYYPQTSKVLALDWEIFPVYGIVQGGKESNESDIETLNREIVEETGFTDFTIEDKLGQNIISHYFATNKKVWREMDLTCYLVRLNSSTQKKRKLEVNESFDLVWIDIDEYVNMVTKHTPTESQDFRSIGEFLKRAKRKLI